MRLANFAPTRVSCITVSISFFIFMRLPFRLSVLKLVSYNLSVYLFEGTLVETKIPT